MSLNRKLPPHLIAQLYPNTLVQLNETSEKQIITHIETPAGDSHPPTIKYLGENQQHISLLVYNPSMAFLPDDELEQLTKILQACQLGLKDVAIVNLAHTGHLEPRQVLIHTRAKQAIIFIPQPDILGLESHVPLYDVVRVADVECTFSEPIDKLIGSKELKLKLWHTLQSLFKLSAS